MECSCHTQTWANIWDFWSLACTFAHASNQDQEMSRLQCVGHWKQQIPNSCLTDSSFRGLTFTSYLSLSSDPARLCSTDVKYKESMPLDFISKSGSYTIYHGMFKIWMPSSPQTPVASCSSSSGQWNVPVSYSWPRNHYTWLEFAAGLRQQLLGAWLSLFPSCLGLGGHPIYIRKPDLFTRISSCLRSPQKPGHPAHSVLPSRGRHIGDFCFKISLHFYWGAIMKSHPQTFPAFYLMVLVDIETQEASTTVKVVNTPTSLRCSQEPLPASPSPPTVPRQPLVLFCHYRAVSIF